MESGHHVISLSLGGVTGPTGLAVIEPKSKYWHPKGDESQLDYANHYEVVWLERLAAGRAYPAIVARVRELSAARRLSRGCSLLVDISVVGQSPLRLFEDQGLYPEPIEVTNATDAAYSDGVQHLSRRDMIGAAQVAFQSNRLEVSSKLELAAALLADLQAFDPTLAGPAARSGQNDDLVTAVAVAVWWADRLRWNDDVAERMVPEEYRDETGRSAVTGY